MVRNTDDVELLVVQDDPAEGLLMREEFGEYRLVNHIEVVHDVPRALAYLDGGSPSSPPVVPDLVLLDVNLPGHGGRMLLRHLRARPETRNVPVILLTDSPAAEQILRAESLPVQGYANKPVDFTCLVSIVKASEILGFEVWRSTP